MSTVPVELMTLEYVQGQRAAVPIVLLPGLFAGGWIWNPSRDFLVAERFSVATLSEPFAALETSPASIRTIGSMLTGLLDQRGIPRAILCGNSMGALVAMDIAYHHPDRVESLVISGCPGLGDGGMRPGPPLSRPGVGEVVDRMFFDRFAVAVDQIEKSLAEVRNRRCEVNMVRYLIAIREYDVKRCLAGIGCPLLMIWGENDQIAPVEEWERHLHLAARGSLHKMPKCGHAPMLERPSEFNAALFAFLESDAFAGSRPVLHPRTGALTDTA